MRAARHVRNPQGILDRCSPGTGNRAPRAQHSRHITCHVPPLWMRNPLSFALASARRSSRPVTLPPCAGHQQQVKNQTPFPFCKNGIAGLQKGRPRRGGTRPRVHTPGWFPGGDSEYWGYFAGAGITAHTVTPAVGPPDRHAISWIAHRRPPRLRTRRAGCAAGLFRLRCEVSIIVSRDKRPAPVTPGPCPRLTHRRAVCRRHRACARAASTAASRVG